MLEKYPAIQLDLVAAGVVARDDLEIARTESASTGEPLESVLSRIAGIPEGKILGIVAQTLNVPFVRISSDLIDKDVIRKVPAKLVHHYKVMPLKVEDGALLLAVTDPMDHRVMDELRLTVGLQVRTVLSTLYDINGAIKRYYGIGAETLEKILDETHDGVQVVAMYRERAQELREDGEEDASIIRFINQILMEALRDNATDIHVEPFEDELRLRYRIDGILHEASVPSSIKRFQASIASRLKVMANMNIAERRMPQDGKIRIRMAGEDFDLRVSVLPTPFGESLNVRILNRSSLFYGLEQLGLSREGLECVERLAERPHGIILVTGPTGSGKTTTLYATLARVNSGEKKIITIEDPIEYEMKGITQMEVLPQIEFTFSRALRHMLRHDPDIMLVGEIRDRETADTAIRSALTGHLVFSTLHTNDASGAFTRLIDMGVEPFLVASSVEAVIAQRLVRKICPQCRVPTQVPQDVLRRFGIQEASEASGIVFYRPVGCGACKFVGYSGRTGIYEIIMMQDEIRDRVIMREPANVIKKRCVELGMVTLRLDGWRKVKQGLTTVEEILRITQEDDMEVDFGS